MGRLVVTESMTLDGVMEEPGFEEHRDGKNAWAIEATAVFAGGADMPLMRDTAAALADALPNGEARFLDGQGHDVDPAVLAPALEEFFL
jgi:hypothetical protein